MDHKAKQGLVLGAIVGVFLGVALSILCDNWLCMLLVPFTALMGMAPNILNPSDDEDDD